MRADTILKMGLPRLCTIAEWELWCTRHPRFCDHCALMKDYRRRMGRERAAEPESASILDPT